MSAYDPAHVRQANANREAEGAGGLFASVVREMEQDLAGQPLPYHRDGPWTERAAAVAGQSRAATHRAMILTYLDRQGTQGATADEIDAHFAWQHLTAARRLSDLAKAGLARCAGDTRLSAQGCPAQVYRTPGAPHAG